MNFPRRNTIITDAELTRLDLSISKAMANVMRHSLAVLAAIVVSALFCAACAAQTRDAAFFRKAGFDALQNIRADFYLADRRLYAEEWRLDGRPVGPAFMWGAGVMLSALNGAAQAEPERYRPWLDEYIAALDSYWNTAGPVAGVLLAPGEGAVDVVTGAATDGLIEARAAGRGALRVEPSWGILGLRVSRASALLRDPQVRLALALAIDRPGLIDRQFGAVAGMQPAYGPVPPGLGGGAGSPDWAATPIADRRARATALLRAAGWAPDAPLDLLAAIPPGEEHAAIITEVAAQLAPLGLRLPFFGTFSGARATVGGGLSNGALFHGTGRHGTAADCALGLAVVLADGTVLQTGQAGFGGRPFYRTYGPDLTGLMAKAARKGPEPEAGAA